MHGMNTVKNKMKSLSKQIVDGVEKGINEVDIQDLELRLTSTQAQFRNYMAYNSTLGTGASRLLSQRKSSNISKAFDALTENLGDKYKSALDGEAFLQENNINSKLRAKLQDQVKTLDDDINVNAVLPGYTETEVDHGNATEISLAYVHGKQAIRLKDQDGFSYDVGRMVVDTAVSPGVNR